MFYTEHYLAKELSKKGWKTVFISSDRYPASWKSYVRKIERKGVYIKDFYSTIRLPAWAPLEKVIFKNPSQLWYLLITGKFDLIHLNSLGSFATMLVLWMKWLNPNQLPPVIVSDHTDTRSHKRRGFYARLYYRFFGIQLQLTQRVLEKVIVFGDVGARVLAARYRLSNEYFKKIPLGFDAETFYIKPEKRNSEDSFVIGFAGKLDKEKRIDFLIETLGQCQFLTSVKLIVIGFVEGSEYCETLRSLAEQANLLVDWKPFAGKKELNNFYNYIDLAVFPGGISITTIEANACGAPIVLYRSIAGLEERVRSGRGKLFSTQNELKDCLQYYYERYKNRGIDHVQIAEITRRASSWQSIVPQYEDVYLQTVSKHRRERFGPLL